MEAMVRASKLGPDEVDRIGSAPTSRTTTTLKS